VELGILSKEDASYRGHMARDMRATAEASRTGRPPQGARNMKGTFRTLLIVLAMATILATVTTGAAMGAKCGHGNNPNCSGGGTSGGGGTVNLVMVGDANADGLANYGDSVTFQVSTTATDKPLVEADCYQSGVRVYSHSAGFYPDYPWPDSQVFNLSSSIWTGGAADCTAQLYMSDGKGGFNTLATLSFPVAA
jgi:hypothetical protein